MERKSPEAGAPYYSIRTRDYVSVVALTSKDEFLLVRQYRPAVDRYTLELPAGHVERGQTPEEAARCELLEETGCVAGRLDFLGTLASDTGRLQNSLWCYFAQGVKAAPGGDFQREAGLEVVVYKGELAALLDEKEFCCSLNVAALTLALRKGFLSLS